MELVAQGIANMASALFGGISVTGTIARTATNVRAGAHSPLSGMLHAAYLLLFMLVAAPLARYIPLAALAGVLVVVCWYMAEKEEFVRLVKDWRSAVVLIPTFCADAVQGPHLRHHRRMRTGRAVRLARQSAEERGRVGAVVTAPCPRIDGFVAFVLEMTAGRSTGFFESAFRENSERLVSVEAHPISILQLAL